MARPQVGGVTIALGNVFFFTLMVDLSSTAGGPWLLQGARPKRHVSLFLGRKLCTGTRQPFQHHLSVFRRRLFLNEIKADLRRRSIPLRQLSRDRVESLPAMRLPWDRPRHCLCFRLDTDVVFPRAGRMSSASQTIPHTTETQEHHLHTPSDGKQGNVSKSEPLFSTSGSKQRAKLCSFQREGVGSPPHICAVVLPPDERPLERHSPPRDVDVLAARLHQLRQREPTVDRQKSASVTVVGGVKTDGQLDLERVKFNDREDDSL